MVFDLEIFDDPEIKGDFIEWLINEQSINVQRHFCKMWEYYCNRKIDMTGPSARDRKVVEKSNCYMQAQEYGLPSRITGLLHSANADVFSAQTVKDIQRKEVVIENDIGWRINTAVDFLFGKDINFVSKSPNSQKRAEIESIVKAVFAANGGTVFFQDMAVLGSVYGFVDCFVRPDDVLLERCLHSFTHAKTSTISEILQLAEKIDLELIDAPRALPILDENDYKKTKCYVQHFIQKKNALSTKNSFLSRLLSGTKTTDNRQNIHVTEIISSTAWQRYEDKELVGEGKLPWGFLPVVHIQNLAQPFYYEGVSDVEPLMPIQDELNTRLSDRASRITFQSFKMYLGKGIEGFENKPISPGRMWYTDNPDASIEEFGGDAATPSENLHIAEIREAMDKISSVPPLAAGVIRSKLGNLTSAVALRITMNGLLSKTERKKITYGEGLKKICKMILVIMDKANVYHTSKDDREFDIIFPSPLPENTMQKLQEAKIKRELGVPAEQVLRELGYEVTEQFQTT